MKVTRRFFHTLRRAYEQMKNHILHLFRARSECLKTGGDLRHDLPHSAIPSSSDSALGLGDIRMQRKKGRHVVLTLSIPEMDPQDIDLQVLGRALRIRAESREHRHHNDGSLHMHRARVVRFERTLPLPTGVDAERSRMCLKGGELRITLPERGSGQSFLKRMTGSRKGC